MKHTSRIAPWAALALITAAQPVPAQENSAAAERARLANQRIRAEAERRANVEEARAAGQSLSSPVTPRDTVPADETGREKAFPSSAPEDQAEAGGPDARGEAGGDNSDISEALDQLRQAGELRDAGYLTQQEFERIKRRILDASVP